MEDHLDIWVKISQQIGELNGFIKTALEKIADHEKRLDDLERRGSGKASIHDIKDTIIMWLVKGVVVAFITIGSLTGASALIQKVLAPSTTQTMEIQK